MLLLRQLVRVNRPAIDHKLLEQKLGHEVDEHVDDFNQPVVYADCNQFRAPPSGKRDEHDVVQRDEQHRALDVSVRAERVAAVEREVPQDGQNQRGKVTGVVIGNLEHIMQQGEADELNEPGGCAEQREFDRLPDVFVLHAESSLVGMNDEWDDSLP